MTRVTEYLDDTEDLIRPARLEGPWALRGTRLVVQPLCELGWWVDGNLMDPDDFGCFPAIFDE